MVVIFGQDGEDEEKACFVNGEAVKMGKSSFRSLKFEYLSNGLEGSVGH